MHTRRLNAMLRGACGTAVCLAFAGCGLNSRYKPPVAPTATAYKETAPASIWKPATPSDDRIRGAWWEMYGDGELNRLEAEIDGGNQSIAAAAAAYQAAAASIVRETRSQYFPTLTVAPSAVNARLTTLPFAQSASGQVYSQYTFPVTATWEPDVWSAVRNNVRAARYAAEQSAANLGNVRLLMHATVAADYFLLRGVEAQRALLDETIDAWGKYVELMRGLSTSGLENEEAVSAAVSQLEAARAQRTNLELARAQYEHALATLVGRDASMFSVAAAAGQAQLPQVPVSVPSELLERRPDIAAAERAVAATHAQVGAARAAYFPALSLTGTAGFESLSAADWFAWPARFWSVGATAAETLFDAGARRAAVEYQLAQRDAAVANYRQTVLTAFQQVEDELAALRVLEEDLREQDAAVQSARRFLDQATVRNTAGLDPFLNVITAQLSLLNYQQTLVSFRTQQMVASVQLIEALGGGWTAPLRGSKTAP